MEVDYGYQEQENEQYEDEDGEQLRCAITQKKRTYRLEIRKKKLQQTFNKTRKFNFQLEGQNGDNYNQQNIQQQGQQLNNGEQIPQEQNDMIQNMYQQNQEQLNQYNQKLDLKAEYDRIITLVNDLNQLIYNFNPNNMNQLEKVVQAILNEYLIEQREENILIMLKQVQLHLSLHLVLKNPHVNISIKNTALWCLINLCQLPADQYELTKKLVIQDIFTTLKILLKDQNNNMLFENIIWLALNISMDAIEYRCKLLEDGFLYFLGNYISHISEAQRYFVQIFLNQLFYNENSLKKGDQEINCNQLKVMLNLCTVMLSIHHQIDDQQFRIIANIMKLCLQINKPEYFNLITNGITSLFIEDNPLSESQFNILYEIRFFSQYFLSCIQTEEDMLAVSNLYKYISLQDFKYIMLLVKQDLIFPMYILMSHPLNQVRENIVFSLSNLFMNGEKFITVASQFMLDTKILSQLDEEYIEVQKEAVWALAVLLNNQTKDQKEEFLSNKEVIKVMCEFLNKNYQQLPEEIVGKLLECFIFILDYGELVTKEDDAYESNPFWISIDRYQSVGIIDKIAVEGTQENQMKAQKILDEYSWIRQS